MIALIDGDVLVYSVGFSVEKKRYEIVDALTGEVVRAFPYSKDMWEYVSVQPQEVLDEWDIEVRKEVEPISHCYQNLKQLLSSIMEKTGATEYRIYLSGPNNFRTAIATIAEYKGNRDPDNKPVYFKELRSKLIEDHNAVITDGEEADDALGIAQCAAPPGTTVIVSKDKDLRMIPGKHLNLNNGELLEVDEWSGLVWFYTQILTGDQVDNIKGCPGIGPKKAEKILAGCKTEKELLAACLQEYNKHYDDPLGALNETGKLLWIRRKPGEIWDEATIREE